MRSVISSSLPPTLSHSHAESKAAVVRFQILLLSPPQLDVAHRHCDGDSSSSCDSCKKPGADRFRPPRSPSHPSRESRWVTACQWLPIQRIVLQGGDSQLHREPLFPLTHVVSESLWDGFFLNNVAMITVARTSWRACRWSRRATAARLVVTPCSPLLQLPAPGVPVQQCALCQPRHFATHTPPFILD